MVHGILQQEKKRKINSSWRQKSYMWNFPKKANFLQDIMHLIKRESWIREEPFMFWIQKSAMYENQLSQQPSSIQFFLHMGRSGKHGFCKGCRNDPGADLQGRKCISARYSREMLNLLLRQTRTWKIPAGLPYGVKCANKTGENDSCQNDVAIVYGKKTTYILCIFAQTDEYSGVNGIQILSSRIYSALNRWSSTNRRKNARKKLSSRS